jgi:hypothetical protein
MNVELKLPLPNTKMHWKTKEKINRIINEKLEACPHNKSVCGNLTAEERAVYNERFGQPDRTYPIDWIMKNR